MAVKHVAMTVTKLLHMSNLSNINLSSIGVPVALFQRLQHVYTTSATSYRRLIDVEARLSVYWDAKTVY